MFLYIQLNRSFAKDGMLHIDKPIAIVWWWYIYHGTYIISEFVFIHTCRDFDTCLFIKYNSCVGPIIFNLIGHIVKTLILDIST